MLVRSLSLNIQNNPRRKKVKIRRPTVEGEELIKLTQKPLPMKTKNQVAVFLLAIAVTIAVAIAPVVLGGGEEAVLIIIMTHRLIIIQH